MQIKIWVHQLNDKIKMISVTIIGGGSVGLCLAASLVQAGAKVNLMVRSASVEALRSEPITVSGMLGEHSINAGQLVIENADQPTPSSLDCDVLAVTTKTYDVADAVTLYAQSPIRPRAILLMQNGLGTTEVVRSIFGPDIPVFSTAMLIGMQRKGLNHVVVSAHSSPVWIGSLLDDRPDPISAMLELASQGFLPMTYKEKIQEIIYSKVLFNSCMNPTGALVDRSYGELLENIHSKNLIVHLADETLRIFAASIGYCPAKNGQEYVENILIPAVIPNSAPHRSSMLQDIESGHRTEIDYLNGAIIELGKTVNVDTPFHESIVSLIHARENV